MGNLAEVAWQLCNMVGHCNQSQPNPGARPDETPCILLNDVLDFYLAFPVFSASELVSFAKNFSTLEKFVPFFADLVLDFDLKWTPRLSRQSFMADLPRSSTFCWAPEGSQLLSAVAS